MELGRKSSKRRLRPEIEVIQELEKIEDLNDAEIFWIGYFRMIGCRLTNLTSGGEGVKGLRLSETRKREIGNFHRGKIETSETRRKKSLSHKGKKHSSEHCLNQGVAISMVLQKKFEDRYAECICAQCGKTFKRLKIHLRNKSVVCSLSCSSKLRWQTKHAEASVIKSNEAGKPPISEKGTDDQGIFKLS